MQNKNYDPFNKLNYLSSGQKIKFIRGESVEKRSIFTNKVDRVNQLVELVNDDNDISQWEAFADVEVK